MAEILIVEDSDHKRSRVISFVSESYPHVTLVEAHSFNAGCRIIEEKDFDLVVMDMSLPTYDKSHVESGGRFRTFGGREMARKMVRLNRRAKIVFLTQYDSFSDTIASHTLSSLDVVLRKECGASYLGIVYFDSSKAAWKESLDRAIASTL